MNEPLIVTADIPPHVARRAVDIPDVFARKPGVVMLQSYDTPSDAQRSAPAPSTSEQPAEAPTQR